MHNLWRLQQLMAAGRFGQTGPFAVQHVIKDFKCVFAFAPTQRPQTEAKIALEKSLKARHVL